MEEHMMKGKKLSLGLSKIISVLLCVALIFGALPMIAQAEPGTAYTYQLVSSLTDGGIYVICAKSGSTYYAMNNTINSGYAGATSSGITVSSDGNWMTSAVGTAIQWTYAASGMTLKNGSNYLNRSYSMTNSLQLTSSAGSYGDWHYNSSKLYSNSNSHYLVLSTSNGFNASGSSSSGSTVYLFQRVSKTVSSIAVNHVPNKTTYTEGETFDPAGMVIRATYNDSTYVDISTFGSPDGYTFTPTGALTTSDSSVSVSYGGKSTTQAITVNAITVTSIEITSPPTNTTYDEGQSFNSSGMVVTAHYSNGTSAPVTEYSVDPSGALTPDNHSVTITYNGKTATQDITVNPLVLDRIEITSEPTKVGYVEDQLFDPAGMVVTAYYTNGSYAAVTGYTWAPDGALSTSNTKVTVTYKDKTVDQAITVAEKALDHIDITTHPSKTTYVVGQTFSSAGMVVKAYYTNGLNEAVTGYTIDPTEPLTMGVTKVTITYTYESAMRTVDQPISVIEKAVDHIVITTPPTKTTYVAGQFFDPADMVVTAYYNDDTNAPATGYTYFPTRALVTSDTTVTVSYGGKTVGQTISVVPVTNAATPNINADTPVDWLAVDIGESASLSVTASVSKGTLTYQWFSNTTGENSGGTAVGPSSESPTLTLNTTVGGTTYYYCVVTNTDTTATGSQTATATSRVAQVIVRKDAQTPIIDETSPADRAVYKDSVSSLQVEAYVDAGVLTYQWYSNTTGENSGGTAIGSPSSSSYLTLNTSTVGTMYYYCIVTNTDNDATGIKIATATSRAARVDVSAFRKGTVLFTFDDGWDDQYTNARPILDTAGFKATAYVNSEFIQNGNEGFMSVSHAKSLYSAGWDIGTHTTNHNDIGDLTDQAHIAELKSLYNDCATWLVANDMPRAAYHVAYPSGLFSSDLIRLLKNLNFKSGRATMFGQQYGIQYQNDYFKLPVYSVGDEDDVLACLDGIDSAAAGGSTIILMLHKVEPLQGDLVTTNEQLRRLVDRAKNQVNAGKLQVMTVTQWYAAQNKIGSAQTPLAPTVTNDDIANTVSGLNMVMEYKLDDAASYTVYDPATFNSLNLAGNHTLAVRYAASGVDPAGPDTVLTFTKTLASLSIATPPTKTDYIEGNIFDATDMVVTANYDDSTSEAVTGYTIDPTDELTLADNKVTVSYTDAGITKTIDQSITVHAKKLASLSIMTPPSNVTYIEGNTFSTAGMTVSANYDNGTSQEIMGYTTTPTGELKTSDTKVTVSYTYDGVTQTVDQLITVNPKSLDYIAITHEPNKTTYIEGNTFISTGMVVTAYYDNGKHEDVTGYSFLPTGALATSDTKVTVSYIYMGVTRTAEQLITVNSKSLDRIAITHEPTQKIYTEGNTFISTGMVVTAYYDNGTQADVLGYSTAPSGPLSTADTKVTVSYTLAGVTRTADQSITVHAKSLTRIEITTPPNKTEYVEGNTFSTAGMVVTAFYDNDTSAVVTGYSVNPSGALAASDVKVTVSYTYVGETRTAEQPITVVAASLDHIRITTEPTKKTYIEGNTFDRAGMVVTAYYNNGMFGTITDYTMTPSGELATSDMNITVSYTYRGVTRTDDQSITVNAKKLSSIEITTQPTNKTYVEGTLFNPAGMVVTAYYDNDKHEAVSGYTIAPSGELTTADTKVTISYTFAGITMTDEQPITVNEKALSSIAITTPPLNTIYIEGNIFNPSGMVVTAYYNNGKSYAVTGYTIAPSGDLKTTDTKATISYTFAGETKTADQAITVNAKKLTSIAITTAPTKTQYIEGQTFDAKDMEVTAYYDNGKHETVTGYTFAPSGELTTSDTKVTVSYTFADVTMTADQPITVALKSLNHIEITTPPSKTAYIEGNTFDPTGMVVTAYFDNGTFTAVTGYSIAPTEALSTTDTKVTVNYGGKTAVQVITVAAKSLDYIAITSTPNKTQYVEGQAFDSAGMAVTAYYDNGTNGPADSFTWKPDAALAMTDTKVTVSFTYEGVTKTADQVITVIAKVITGLNFKTHPTTVKYVEGQTFNPAGMVLTAAYNDGSYKDVQPGNCTFSINRPLKATDKSIDITYDSMHVTQSITVLTKAALQITCYDDSKVIFPIGLAIFSDKGLTHKVASKVANSVTGVILFTGLDAGTYYVTVASVPSPYHLPKPNILVKYTVAYGQTNKQNLVLAKSLVYAYNSTQLKDIKVTAGTTLSPKFDPGKKSYTLLLNEHTAKTTITPKLADESSKLYINGKKASSKTFTLETGKSTKVTIKVQPKSGKANTYTVTIKRAASTNTSLASIKASKGSLKKINTKKYTVNLSSTQTSTTFSLKLADKTAKYTMMLDGKKTSSKTVSMKPGTSRTLVITVTPQAGSAYAIKYTITIIRAK
jgi:peptidoglycan/xylan/chitin deacetylase (PgdA/CDA1 family)